MDDEMTREQLKGEMLAFVDAIVSSGTMCISVEDGSMYNLALTFMRFFDLNMVPYNGPMYDPTQVYVEILPPAPFVFEYFQSSSCIHLVSIPRDVHCMDHGIPSIKVQKLKEEIIEYIDNNSDYEINQMYFYIFISIM